VINFIKTLYNGMDLWDNDADVINVVPLTDGPERLARCEWWRADKQEQQVVSGTWMLRP
jgi:hypothetical protein